MKTSNKKDTVVGVDENGNLKEYPNPMNPPEAVEMSTDVFSKEMLTELNKRTKAIKNCQGKIDSSFETIAFNLYWINSKEAYKAEGCDSIVKYADEYFGYAKTTCYSLINVVDRFAKRDEAGHYLEELDERVKGYSVSKLSLMVGLTDEQISRLTPDMSVRDIKKFVKSLEGKAMPELPDGNGEEEEETTEPDNNIVDSFARDLCNVYIDLINPETNEIINSTNFEFINTKYIADMINVHHYNVLIRPVL